MSRLPFKGWKTAHRAVGLGLLGASLAIARPAMGGSVFVAANPSTGEIPLPPSSDSAYRGVELAPESRMPASEGQADPIGVLARFSDAESSPPRAPIFEIAPPNPFVLSSMGKPQEPVKSIPTLPAVWSGMTGLAVLGTLACTRRLRRALR